MLLQKLLSKLVITRVFPFFQADNLLTRTMVKDDSIKGVCPSPGVGGRHKSPADQITPSPVKICHHQFRYEMLLQKLLSKLVFTRLFYFFQAENLLTSTMVKDVSMIN